VRVAIQNPCSATACKRVEPKEIAIPMGLRQSALILLAISFFTVRLGLAEPIPVKHVEGAIHGFMLLRTEEGKAIAIGDLDQTVEGARVTTNLKFRFEDGSIHEETTVFSQRGVFRVLSDHLLEKGPAFKKPIEVWIDCSTGQVKVRDMEDGKDKVTTHHVEIPVDLANGIVPMLIQNFPDDAEHTVTILAATPKPRIVKFVITPESEDTFSIAGTKYKAKQYTAKVQIGGVAGAVAPVVGQQPPDSHFWIFKGAVPIFLKSIGPISAGTPVWQIELASPTWGRDQK
jgi:hypothetical protein